MQYIREANNRSTPPFNNIQKSLICYFLSCLVILFSGYTEAKIYKWVDKSGKVHYGDKPPEQIEDTESSDSKMPTKNN